MGAAIALLGAGVAQAEKLELFEPRRPPPSVAELTLWGGLAGGTVGGAIIGYQLSLQNQGSYNWAPVLATSIGIGLATGLVWGIAEAMAGRPPNLVNGPVSDGMSLREMRPTDLSGQFTIPLLAARF